MEVQGIKEKREVEHFTAERTTDYAYGYTWNQIVQEYLRSGYNAADDSSDIVVMGKTYRVLRRLEVTVFYDDTGDTLFDVTNERLEKEYEWLMNGSAGDVAENMDTKEEDEPAGASDVTRENAESVQEPPEPVKSKGTGKRESRPAKQQAEEKLKKELAVAKDKFFAEPIIGYLLERCREDKGLAEDVIQDHKTWQKCFDYIYSRARKQANGSCAAVRDDVVYEWAEDYYHKDDKVEEEKKAKKEAEDKAKREKSTAERKTAKVKREKSAAEKKTAKAKGNTDKVEKVSVPPKPEALQAPPKPKKNGKEMDGQLDLFAMMGM